MADTSSSPNIYAVVMSFPNIYTHRKVADTAARSCDICYKQSTSVLITPEKQVSECVRETYKEPGC